MNHGTRGDVQPLVVLGRELARRGHSPVLAVPGGAGDFVRAAGLPVEPLPGDWQAFFHDPAVDRRWLTAGDVNAMLAVLRNAMTAHTETIAQTLHRLSADADLIVSGSPTEGVATVCAEAHGVPLALLHPFPVRRNHIVANPIVTGCSSTVPQENLTTHDAYEKSAWEARRAGINRMRAALGMAATDRPTTERARMLGAIELQAYSHHMFPGLEWPEYRPQIGWLALDGDDRRAVGEHGLDADLAAWLAEGPAPGYFGFGSMPVGDPSAMMSMIDQVAADLGTRAVVAAGWAALPGTGLCDPKRVRVIGNIDHGALFPHCSFAVHHGGSGTTGATVRAGLPTLITSVIFDQVMWGEALERRGAGVHIPLRELDLTSLRAGIERLRAPSIAEAAGKLGDAVRAEPDSAAAAADIVIAHARQRLDACA